MTLLLPFTPGQVLLWSNVVLLWMAGNYVVPPRPASPPGPSWILLGRALALAITAVALGGWPAWRLGIFLLLLAGALPLGRKLLAPRRLRAEWELGCNALMLLGAAVIIGTCGLENAWAPMFGIPVSRLAAISLLAAGTVFLFRGAAEIVRGILEKAESIPLLPASVAGQAMAQEFNRGRLIGYLERLLIMAIVMASQFAALGVLIAAKGLIRSRELDNHEFAEYFLIGTLASITVAFFVGLGLRALVFPLR